MSREILLIVEALSNERGVGPEVIFSAIESAIESATQKNSRMPIQVEVKIDPQTGAYQTWRIWQVVADDAQTVGEGEEEQDFDPDFHIRQAEEKAKGYEIGDFVKEQIASVDFGRVSAQAAKQIIQQKVREAERQAIQETFAQKIDQLVPGTVKRFDRNGVYVDLGNGAQGFIPKDQLIGGETFREGDRIRAVVRGVSSEGRGPQVLLSRSCKQMVEQLFRIEIPEISEERIEIMGVSRDPGVRSKIAVRSLDPRVPAYGACIGVRGSRIHAIQRDLFDERLDVIEWDEDPVTFVSKTMAPAEVLQVAIDEQAYSMDIAVSDDTLGQAIGRGGQNVRMASKLTGWDINVMSLEEFQKRQEKERQTYRDRLAEELGIDEGFANILVQSEILTAASLVDLDIEELLKIEGLDEEVARELKERAQDALLAYELSDNKPDQSLLDLRGISQVMADNLARAGVRTLEDLAELAIDELMEIEDIGQAKAGRLIMAARDICWNKKQA